jgi:hypothetical protein
MGCAKENSESVVQFSWPEDVKISEIYGRVVVQYSDSHIGWRKIYKWAEGSKGG